MRAALAVALLLVACDTVRVGPAEPSPGAPPAPAPAASDDPGDAPCETLTRAACLRSLVCTLEAPSGRRSDRYVCRPAAGNCEIGLRQLDADRDRCDARVGCMWRSASCYCPCRGSGRTTIEDPPSADVCGCACSGGPPPGCVPRG
ncbi:MAG: hypothetical protein KF729_16880 [Sandaracinaceae bacterium]|nr:hypothetical protein [Sandaracinaceae bacterium]